MIEYTGLKLSKRLRDMGFDLSHNFDNVAYMYGGDPQDEDYDSSLDGVYGYRSDVLLEWLLTHGDSIEIALDLEGFNVTFWKGHHDYNGINIFLCDALAEVVMKVLEVKP